MLESQPFSTIFYWCSARAVARDPGCGVARSIVAGEEQQPLLGRSATSDCGLWLSKRANLLFVPVRTSTNKLRKLLSQEMFFLLASGADCSDKSIHCNLARSLDMCKFEFYQKECCSSCGKNRISNTTTTAVNDEVAEDEDTD